MIRLLRELRLVPVVVVAVTGLLALKLLGLLFDGGYILVGADGDAARLRSTAAPPGAAVDIRPPAIPSLRDAAAGRQNRGDASARTASEDRSGDIITGSAAPKKEEAKPKEEKKQPAEPKPDPGGKPINLNGPTPVSASERAILERLQERRKELDARAREIEIRENMLKSAEKRLEERSGDAKQPEPRSGPSAQRKDEPDNPRVKSLVTMYENMKAKDAARIFDRLDIKILVEVASQINPRRMSDILGQMSAEAAERLTVELAARANIGERTQNADQLPKIEARPGGG